jgi:DMSO/TMAO reductase YedYZ heme-binding membrane subunit
VLHFWYHKLAKNNLAEPMLYAAALGVLLGARLLHWLAGRRRAALATAVTRRT